MQGPGWRGPGAAKRSGLRCGRLGGRRRVPPRGPSLMCLTDSDGFLSSAPSPAWQMLLIDLFGGSWLQFPTDTLINLSSLFF